MVTALMWTDAVSFKEHLNDMRIFRKSHAINLTGKTAPLKDVSAAQITEHKSETAYVGDIFSFIDKHFLVSQWDISLSRDIQN